MTNIANKKIGEEIVSPLPQQLRLLFGTTSVRKHKCKDQMRNNAKNSPLGVEIALPPPQQLQHLFGKTPVPKRLRNVYKFFS